MGVKDRDWYWRKHDELTMGVQDRDWYRDVWRRRLGMKPDGHNRRVRRAAPREFPGWLAWLLLVFVIVVGVAFALKRG